MPTPEAQAILTGEGGAKAEQILPYFVIRFLPRGLSGLVIAGVPLFRVLLLNLPRGFLSIALLVVLAGRR